MTTRQNAPWEVRDPSGSVRTRICFALPIGRELMDETIEDHLLEPKSNALAAFSLVWPG